MHRLPRLALPVLLSLFAMPAHALDFINNAVNDMARQLIGAPESARDVILLGLALKQVPASGTLRVAIDALPATPKPNAPANPPTAPSQTNNPNENHVFGF